MGGAGSHLVTVHRRWSGLVIRVDCARWGQTPEDLRHLSRLLLADPRMVRLALLCVAGGGRAASVGRAAQTCLALSAPHARARELALALFDITQHRSATQVAMRTG